MSDKFYVGQDLISCSNNGRRPGITSVTFQVDRDRTATAGVYSGLDLYAVCPFGTNEIATAVLQRVAGYQYQAFQAEGANIDPAMELGDGVTVDGAYSVISAIADDGNYPTLSAPGEEELEDEFPYHSPTQRELSGDVDELRAFITRSLGEMAQQITTLTGRVEGLIQTVSAVSSKVTELDSRVSSLEQGG